MLKCLTLIYRLLIALIKKKLREVMNKEKQRPNRKQQLEY